MAAPGQDKTPEKCPGCGATVEPGWTVCEKCLLPKNILAGENEVTVVVKCPHCGGRIGPNDALCPACRKPRPHIEISPESRDTPPPKQSSSSNPMVLLAMGLGALVFGGVLYNMKTGKPEAPAPAEVVAPPVSTAAAAAALAAATTAQTPAPPDEWAIKGQAYELMSLKAVGGLELTFTDRLSGKKHAAVTDAAGSYSVKVPILSEGGYQVSIKDKGLERSFFEEMDPPYKSQDKGRRKSALELMGGSEVLHVPIMLPRPQTDLSYDVVLTPR
ncbi:MAG: zinc ribbon domain-containing protein [Elusimicrobia bacterium]|nr:zinc ribbon domain-containing protein [Elusimicrobiota bacterium]